MKEDEILLWALYYVGQSPFPLNNEEGSHSEEQCNKKDVEMSKVSVSCKRCRCRAVFAAIVCERKGSPS